MSNTIKSTRTNSFPSRAFWTALLIPVIILCLMLYKPLTTATLGEEVRLATLPVDPIDLFYGEYVILNLAITEVPLNLVSIELQDHLADLQDSFSYHSTPVYVALELDKTSDPQVTGVYKPVSVTAATDISKNRQHVFSFLQGPLQPSGVYLQGYIQAYVYNDTVRIEYGINRYYVEQGQGILLENAARDGQVYVDAKIRKGHWILTGIEVQ